MVRLRCRMSLEFQKINRTLFKEILRAKMKWIEAKKLFDEVAEELFQKYVNRADEVGFDFYDPDTLSSIIPSASTFLGPNPTIYQGKADESQRSCSKNM